jgi:glycosyl transferase family 25
MFIYVINLDRSPERLRNFETVNAHMPGIQRFSAVDGNTIDRMELAQTGLIDPSLSYSNGAIGCALSHLFFWDAAIAENQEITVCEDDSIFHHGFVELASTTIKKLPPDWDLIMWGWNFDSILLMELPGIAQCLATFNQDELRQNARQFQQLQFVPACYRLFRAFGTVCYTVSPKGARKLRQQAVPIRPFTVPMPMINPQFPNTGIDVVMNRAYPDLNAFVSFPPLVITKNEHAISTVRP